MCLWEGSVDGDVLAFADAQLGQFVPQVPILVEELHY